MQKKKKTSGPKYCITSFLRLQIATQKHRNLPLHDEQSLEMCCWHICVDILKGSDWSAESFQKTVIPLSRFPQPLPVIASPLGIEPRDNGQINHLSFTLAVNHVWVLSGTATAELVNSAPLARCCATAVFSQAPVEAIWDETNGGGECFKTFSLAGIWQTDTYRFLI